MSARFFGRLTDKKGKQETFALLAAALCGPLVALTLLPAWPLPVLIGVSTLLFVVMSGRMIPGMALMSSAADPALRGTFMALNAAAQSAAMGLAAMVGGHLISRDASGHIEGYWMAGLAGAALSLLSIAVSRKLVLHTSAGVQRQP